MIIQRIIAVLIVSMGKIQADEDAPRAVNGVIFTGIKNQTNSCKFTVNQITYETTMRRLPGLHFGMVKYNCSNLVGTLISKFETCSNCTWICEYNEGITICKAFYLPLSIGVVLGVITLLLIFLSYKVFKILRANKRQQVVSLSDVIELRSPGTPHLATVILIMVLCFPLIFACDRTFMIASDTKTCENYKCEIS